MSQDLLTDAPWPWLTDDDLVQQQSREAEFDVMPDNWNRGAPDHPAHDTGLVA
jgi:hypothetical protein